MTAEELRQKILFLEHEIAFLENPETLKFRLMDLQAELRYCQGLLKQTKNMRQKFK